MNKSAAGYFTAAFLFLLIALFLLTVMQPVWWSIVTAVIAFLATMAAVGRGLYELRRAKS